MLKNIIITLFLMTNSLGYGQSFENFKKDFKNGLEKDFSEESLNKMFSDYSNFLTPQSDITQLMSNLKGQQLYEYPLHEFKEDSLYKNNISQLLFSTNKNQRILAYIVIAGAGDINYENILLRKIKEETDKGCLVWSGMALLHLKSNKTDELFDFLVENETFGEAHMLPLYIKLNPDSLQRTAYSKMNSDKDWAKVLAVQILSVTQLNDKTEELLKKAVRDWNINIKGYAIYSVKKLRIGNLAEIFKPLLDSSQTRSIALEALSNSPTKNDQDLLLSLVNTKDSVNKDLLNAFLNSRNKDNVKKWLELLYTKPISKDYYFSVVDKPLLNDKELLNDLYLSLSKIKEPKILAELLRALKNQNDDKSNEILIDFLSHTDSDVRYWAASSLKGHLSDKLKAQLPKIIQNTLTNNVGLTNLAIENNLNNLHSFYENIYKTKKEKDWQRSSIEYLAHFPLKKHRKMFRTLLKDKEVDFSIRQDAALGLGNLKDTKSVDLLIRVCEEQQDDFNCRPYLKVLAMLKTDKSRLEVEKYKNSSEEIIRDLVAELLKNW